ncbi:MAG: hypothetical protein JXB34_06790 [Bacteroidales bacterium]|nr:hypothetical protein [Bacteroidales bacterium]
MKKSFLLLMATLLCLQIFAQENVKETDKPVEVKVSGFIMNNLFFDNRKNADALDGMVLLYPLPPAIDSLGNDLNKVPNLTLLSFASRLKFGISGPDAFGAKTTGLIEFDFTARSISGSSTTAGLRFRQAWAKLNWENTELLAGRAWHPLASIDVVPSVMALSIGAPFQPFNRSDQVTVTYKAGYLNFIASASFQNDYTSNGPAGKTYAYQNNSLIPNLHAQVKLKSDNLIIGAGFDYKKLLPRTTVTSPVYGKIASNGASVNCAALLAYGQYKTGKLTVSAKTILSSNTSESLMTGAFGTVSRDSVTGYEEYTPFRHFFAWGNISYGKKLKGSLFAGYLKNLGTAENILPHTASAPSVYGLGESIANMLRITPTLSYTSGKAIIALELEHNITAHGSIDYYNKAKIINAKKVSGTRLMATMYYNF